MALHPTLRYSDHFFVSHSTYLDHHEHPIKLVYSGRSGKLVVLAQKDYEMLEKRELPPIDSDCFKALSNAEILVSVNDSDMESIIARNNNARNGNSILYFVILPTSFCNMGCTYCGQSHKKGGLNNALSQKIITRISSAIKVSAPKGLSIAWFGGEPLVGYAKIIELSDALIHLANQANISYTAKMVTNGSLLTLEKLHELHERCKVNEYHITLDGPQKMHDARRFLKKGGASFQHIISLVQSALKDENLKRVRFVFRTNIDKINRIHINEYLEFMSSAGFSHKNVGFDLKPVYPWSNDVSAVEIERKEFAQWEVEWMTKTLELGLDLGYLQSATKILCTALDPYAEVISSSGNLFSCTEHPLVPIHEKNDSIGTVDDVWDGQRSKGRFDDFNEKILNKEMPCSSCKLLGVCGGSCPKQWEQGYVACPSLKYNLQDRLDIAAIKMGYRIDVTG